MYAVEYDRLTGAIRSVRTMRRAGWESPSPGCEIVYTEEPFSCTENFFQRDKASIKGSLSLRSRNAFALVHLRSLGDVIAALPALRAFVRETRQPLLVASSPAHLALLERIPFLSGAVSYDQTGSVHAVRHYDLEQCADPETNPYDRFANALLGRVLAPSEVRDELRPLLREGEVLWANELLQEAFKGVKLNSFDASPRLSRWIALVSTASSRRRLWGKELELIRAWPEQPFVILNASRLSEYDDPALPNVLNLTGRTSVTQFLAVLASSSVACAGLLDTSALHACAMMRVPYMALLGGVHPPSALLPKWMRRRSEIVLLASQKVPNDALSYCPMQPCLDGIQGNCLDTPQERVCFLQKAFSVETIKSHLATWVHSERFAQKDGSRKRFRLAALSMGGLGDQAVHRNLLRQILPHLREKLPGLQMTLYVRNTYSLFRNGPEDYEQTVGGALHPEQLAAELLREDHADAILDLRYVVQVLGRRDRHRELERMLDALLSETWQGSATLGRDSGKFVEQTLLDSLPPEWNIKGDGKGLPFPEAFSGLSGRYDSERRLLEKLFSGRELGSKPFVLVANGTDGWFPQRLTKRIPLKTLALVAERLLLAGIPLVEIGPKDVSAIPARGVRSLIGKTSLEGLLFLLQRLRENHGVLLSCENGTTHLAGQMRLPAVVAFGPTDPLFWKYPTHDTVLADETEMSCSRRPCWFSTPQWHLECPLGLHYVETQKAYQVKDEDANIYPECLWKLSEWELTRTLMARLEKEKGESFQ